MYFSQQWSWWKSWRSALSWTHWSTHGCLGWESFMGWLQYCFLYNGSSYSISSVLFLMWLEAIQSWIPSCWYAWAPLTQHITSNDQRDFQRPPSGVGGVIHQASKYTEACKNSFSQYWHLPIHGILVISNNLEHIGCPSVSVKLSRSPSNCQDPIWSKIDPLLLPQLYSNHPLRFWHYTNHAPELRPTPKSSDALSLFSKNPEWPPRSLITFLSSSFSFSPLALRSCFHIPDSVFIFLFSIYYTVSVLLFSCSSLHSTIVY